jgi:alkanesulfonate monooxygenase SsuD/methylene tetrahydromethanopterin reductase-like flavin-dependent oxidoreductase (luciferase family)
VDLGVAVRSMGPQSQPEVLLACVRAAEDAGLADVWVQDHLAIPPDDAEGSGGRYLDPLTALAWLAGRTSRIGLGTGVLNLPYRPALPTAKAIATVQELSGGRLRLGVGVGWMDPEFRALGVPRAERGRRSDAALDFLHRAFASDVVAEHDQPFLFLPRPAGRRSTSAAAASTRCAAPRATGTRGFPMGGDPAALAAGRARLADLAAEFGRPRAGIVAFAGFDPRAPARVADTVGALREAGVDRLVAGVRYADADAFADHVAFLAESVSPAAALGAQRRVGELDHVAGRIAQDRARHAVLAAPRADHERAAARREPLDRLLEVGVCSAMCGPIGARGGA